MKNVNIKDLICLEEGTGAGNMTKFLAKNGAKLVYSISNREEHLDYVKSRLTRKEKERVKFVNADLRDLRFIKDEEIDLVTAHMLINLLSPNELLSIFQELTRVTKRGGLIVINDYNPLESYNTKRSFLVEELFNIENGINYIVEGKPSLSWYPSEYVIKLLNFLGWNLKSIELIFKRTPWDKNLIKEHIEFIEELCDKLNDKNIKRYFLNRIYDILNKINEKEIIYSGTI